ncbi:hypothetical protein ACGC1H_001935 [Rhizoctonia solani]
MGIPLFEPRDGDMQISVNETRLETYKYLIKRFRGLRLLGILEKNPLEISAQRNNLSAKDSCATFRILYAFVVSGPFALTSQTHISTLQVATTYEYQALWDYCIQRLETPELDAVKRIELAHEFDVPEWENPVCRQLGMRDEPITRGGTRYWVRRVRDQQRDTGSGAASEGEGNRCRGRGPRYAASDASCSKWRCIMSGRSYQR